MADKHTVHLREGGKVTIKGDHVEVHLSGPVTFRRQHWIKYLTPTEEAARAVRSGPSDPFGAALAEAFAAVPMTVYREED